MRFEKKNIPIHRFNGHFPGEHDYDNDNDNE